MRLIKMLGLAMVASIAAMAFIGAGSASAVVLCEESNKELGECTAGATFANGTELHTKLVAGTNAVLLSSLGNVTCKKSESLGNTVSSTEAALDGEITSLSFEECTDPFGGNCTVTVNHLPYLVLLLLTELKAGEPDYHIVVEKKGANGDPEALVNCPEIGLKCEFTHPEVLFKVLNLATDVDLDVLQELNKLGGLFCPTTATWHAEYLVLCLKPSLTSKGCWPAMKP